MQANHKLDLVNIVTFADSEYIYGIQKDAIASARPFVLVRRIFVGPEGLDYDLDGRIDFPDFPEGIWEIGTIIDCDVRWDVGGPYADVDFAVDETPSTNSGISPAWCTARSATWGTCCRLPTARPPCSLSLCPTCRIMQATR